MRSLLTIRSLLFVGCTAVATLGLLPNLDPNLDPTRATIFEIAAASAQINTGTRNNCESPRSNEFLILVLNDRNDTQTRVQQEFARSRDENGNPLAPRLTICNYLGDQVVRVESFATAATASEWAQYLNQQLNVQAFVARSPQPGRPSAPIGGTPPAGSGSTPGGRYDPRPLGQQGFAVIVNYGNRPEVAAEVRQVTRRSVGLVAYNQNPYLLASYTTSADEAAAVLRSLSDRGLLAGIVNSREVILLSPAVVETTTPTRPNNPTNPTTPTRPLPDGNTGGGRSG